VQWNIANNIVDTSLSSNDQIDSFMTHIYYECAYKLKHYKNHPRHKVYYKGEGGDFLQIRAMVNLVNPSLSVASPSTKSAPTMY